MMEALVSSLVAQPVVAWTYNLDADEAFAEYNTLLQ